MPSNTCPAVRTNGKKPIVVMYPGSGDWTIQPAPIGHGSFSTVFLNVDTPGIKRVVKICNCCHGDCEKNFLIEIAILKSFDSHPNVIEFIQERDAWDCGKLRKIPGYLCPYYPQGDLYTQTFKHVEIWGAKKLGLPMPKLIRVIADILCGLEYVHSKGVTHRDVKLENVLVNGDVYLLCDFNCAIVDVRPAIGMYVQSNNYRAPENILECINTGGLGAMDLWSFGCMIVELVISEFLYNEKCPTSHLLAIERDLGPIPGHMLKTSYFADDLVDQTGVAIATGIRGSEHKLENAMQRAAASCDELGDAVAFVVNHTLRIDPAQRSSAAAVLAKLREMHSHLFSKTTVE